MLQLPTCTVSKVVPINLTQLYQAYARARIAIHTVDAIVLGPALVGALVGTLVGTLAGALVGALVSVLVRYLAGFSKRRTVGTM
jgi:hypothetical protein